MFKIFNLVYPKVVDGQSLTSRDVTQKNLPIDLTI
jgi:hypothetical protein